MNRLLRLSTLLRLGVGIPIVSLTLAGCFLSSSSSDDTPAPPPPTLMVTSVSGAHRPMDGTWIRCVYTTVPGSIDEEEMVTLAGLSVNVVTTNFSSTDLSCTGTPTPVSTVNAIAGSAGDKTAIWWDGTATPPTTQPTGLATTYTPTMIYFGTTKAIILIDDRTLPWVFWSACGNGGCTVDGAGYPNYLEPTAAYAHIKQ